MSTESDPAGLDCGKKWHGKALSFEQEVDDTDGINEARDLTPHAALSLATRRRARLFEAHGQRAISARLFGEEFTHGPLNKARGLFRVLACDGTRGDSGALEVVVGKIWRGHVLSMAHRNTSNPSSTKSSTGLYAYGLPIMGLALD